MDGTNLGSIPSDPRWSYEDPSGLPDRLPAAPRLCEAAAPRTRVTARLVHLLLRARTA